MAMMPIDVVPCLKVHGTTVQIPLIFLKKLLLNETVILSSKEEQDKWNLSHFPSEFLSLKDTGVMSIFNLTNLTGDNEPTPPEPDSLISSPLYLSVSIASVIGNLIMVLVVLCKKRFRKPVNLLVANLSFSSFLFILSSNLRLLENSLELWTYTTFICQFLAVLHRIPIPVIALTTMTISLDRGRIARNPLLGSNNVNPIWRIIYIWTFSIIILVPLAFTRKFDSCITSPYKCSKVFIFNTPVVSILYGVMYLLSVHIIPAVILVQETTKTINKIRFLKISGTSTTQQNLPFPSLPDNRLRLLRNSCIFCVIFLVFWLPYGVFQFPLDLPRELIPEILETYIHIYFKFFRNITFCLIALNPVILFVLSYDLLKHIPGTRFRM